MVCSSFFFFFFFFSALCSVKLEGDFVLCCMDVCQDAWFGLKLGKWVLFVMFFFVGR